MTTPCFRTRYLWEQATVAPEASGRLFCGVYPGGQMVYLQRAGRAEFAMDVRAFCAGTN